MTSHLGSGQNLAESLNKIHNGWMEPSDYMDFLFQGSLSKWNRFPSLAWKGLIDDRYARPQLSFDGLAGMGRWALPLQHMISEYTSQKCV